MPKKTSSKKAKAQDGDRTPSPPPVPLVLTDYLPSGFAIPVPEEVCTNFEDGEGGIKRPPNSWICYRSESTRFMRELHTIDERGNEKFMEQGLVSRLCSQMWHTMSKEEKGPWVRHAAMIAAEHKRQYPHYVFAPKTKEQKEKEKGEGKPASRVTKRVPSKSTPRAKAAPYPQPAPVSRIPPPTPIAGPSRLPNAPTTYKPLPYIPQPSADLSSNPYAALTTLPYPAMPPFKPFSVPLPIPPDTASPSLSDYTPSPGTTAVPTPEESMVAFDTTSTQHMQPEEDQQQLFDWEMNEFFMSLARMDVPNYASDILSADPGFQNALSGILPVVSLKTEPGMSVAVGNLPRQEAALLSAQQTFPADSLDTLEPQHVPDLEHDWINHPSLQCDFVSLSSNEVWPGGEWLWGMGESSTTGFGGQTMEEQQSMHHDESVTPLEPWYQLQGEVTNDPVDWNTDSGMQSQDNYGMEAEYLDQSQLNNEEVDEYYTEEDTMPPSTYVPPTGAAFSSNRRVGGTWQLHTHT